MHLGEIILGYFKINFDIALDHGELITQVSKM